MLLHIVLILDLFLSDCLGKICILKLLGMAEIDPRLEAVSQSPEVSQEKPQQQPQPELQEEPRPESQEEPLQAVQDDSQEPPPSTPQKSKGKRKYELHDSPSRAEIRGAELFRKHLVAQGAIKAHKYSRTYLFDFFNIPRSSGHRILKLPTARQFAHGDGNVETRGRKRKPRPLPEPEPLLQPPPQPQEQQQEQHIQQVYEPERMVDPELQ